ncbi:M56 family metallopeptidase [Gorillibacterium massiliense]|uniref:M56 family metallopeptidase n=1 Tax=Gorillibacterium massiliense TaxID=1280390 RepID=UPI0004AD5D32|nr:M56 family metallopeptidase [Gorillibacterium massiliense]
MREWFAVFLSLSVSGSLIAVVLLTLRPFARRWFSHTWQYYIWLIVVARLLLPVTLEPNVIGGWLERNGAVHSALGFSEAPAVAVESNEGVTDSLPVSNTHTEKVADASDQDQPKQDHLVWKLWPYLWRVWIIGAIGMFLYRWIGYKRFTNRLKVGNTAVTSPNMRSVLETCRRELGLRGHVEFYLNPLVTTPMLVGFKQPAILLPNHTYTDDELRYICLHELTHFKRMDLSYKWLTQAALCLHWFNPLVHYAAKEIDRLCELSCDESVIRKMNAHEKQGYGNTLIAMAALGSTRRSLFSGAMSEQKRHLKERLAAIMRSQPKSSRVTIVSLAIAILLVGSALVVGAVTASGSQNGNTPKTGRGSVSPPVVLYAGYDLDRIAQDRNPYVGNHVKDGRLIAQLLSPDPFYVQHFLALQTARQPYGLTAFYEPTASSNVPRASVPTDFGPNSDLAVICSKNALVLFAMIDNVDDITFAFRNTSSAYELDESAYGVHLTFHRADFAAKYDLSELSRSTESLGKELENWGTSAELGKLQ